jgi:thymidine kinase
MVAKIFVRGEQATLVPARVASRAEEIGSHIIVHAVDFPAELAKVRDHFRTDETGRTGDEELAHVYIHIACFYSHNLIFRLQKPSAKNFSVLRKHLMPDNQSTEVKMLGQIPLRKD